MSEETPELKFLDAFCREWASDMWEPMEPEDRTLEALLDMRQIDLAECQDKHRQHLASRDNCEPFYEVGLGIETELEALEEWCEAIETAIDRRDAAELIGGGVQ